MSFPSFAKEASIESRDASAFIESVRLFTLILNVEKSVFDRVIAAVEIVFTLLAILETSAT